MNRLASLVVATVGLAVMAAWHDGNESLLSVLPNAVTMKYVTALSFVLAGIGFAFARSNGITQRAVRDGCAMILLCVQIVILLRGAPTEFEGPDSVHTVAPGEPSLMTVASFMTCVAIMIIDDHFPLWRRRLARVLIVAGMIAVAGHALGWPLLTYFLPGVSTGMAIHTAMSFIALGLCASVPARQSAATRA